MRKCYECKSIHPWPKGFAVWRDRALNLSLRYAMCDTCESLRRAEMRERRARGYHRYRKATDLQYALRRTLRKRTMDPALLGCELHEFVQHIAAQFLPGMTWNNWTTHGWHLDHKRPLASFDLTDPEQRAQAGHWTNFQPLWAKDNLAKGARWVDPASLF